VIGSNKGRKKKSVLPLLAGKFNAQTAWPQGASNTEEGLKAVGVKIVSFAREHPHCGCGRATSSVGRVSRWEPFL